MNEIEVLVSSTIEAITAIAARVARFATWLAAGVGIVSVTSLLLGAAALSGARGVRTLWIVLGIVFAAIALGAALLARWRVGMVRKDVPALANDVRALIADGTQNTRDLIDQFQSGHRGSATDSAIAVSRRVIDLRGLVGQGLAGSARITNAVTAITSFPGLALASITITAVFGVLALLFLIALAL